MKEMLTTKDEQLNEFSMKCTELMKASVIEIPLTFMKQSLPKPQKKQKQQPRAKSHNKSKNQLQFVKEINQEMQQIIDEEDQYGYQNDLKMPTSLQNTLKKKKKQCKSSGSFLHEFVNIESIVQNQVFAAKTAEKVI